LVQVYGLAAGSALIGRHNLDGLISPFSATNVLGACIVTWQADAGRHLKVRLKKNSPPGSIRGRFYDL
jgi:hypothetical protein